MYPDNTMNILGIDYGTKRIGLAWVQSGLDLILPYGVVTQEELPELIQRENIDRAVVGLPLGLEDGSENDNTKRIREFGDWLIAETGIHVEYIDERMSSQQADRMEGDMSRDEKAAMVMLQAYLAKQ